MNLLRWTTNWQTLQMKWGIWQGRARARRTTDDPDDTKTERASASTRVQKPRTRYPILLLCAVDHVPGGYHWCTIQIIVFFTCLHIFSVCGSCFPGTALAFG